MPLAIPNTTLADNYSAATTFAGTDVFAWGFFTVANNPAFVQLGEGVSGQAIFQNEVYCPPATYPIAGGAGGRPISGIRARNAVAGSNAQFFGSLFYPQEPGIQAGTPFAAIVAPSGGVGVGGVIDFQTFVAPVTITGITEAGATTIVSAAPFTADGFTSYLIEFFSPRVDAFTQQNPSVRFVLFENGATIGFLGELSPNIASGAENTNVLLPIYLQRVITPSVGAKTYSIRAFHTLVQQPVVQAGAGGAGLQPPGFIRISSTIA